jgi:hypothetical protein
LKINAKRISQIEQEWRKFDEFWCEVFLRDLVNLEGFGSDFDELSILL